MTRDDRYWIYLAKRTDVKVETLEYDKVFFLLPLSIETFLSFNSFRIEEAEASRMLEG